MEKNAKIYVAGHNGMVGSAIVKQLKLNGYHNILVKTRAELDLTRQEQVEEFFAKEKIEYVFLAAAKVGGIMANSTYPADFMYENMMLEMNVIKSAHLQKVKKLLFLGSSCIYPRMAAQPIKEEYLLTGELEPTNEAYALAKISGMKYCEYLNKQYGTNFISVMPTNLYGPKDNYHPTNSHVMAAMIHKMHLAKVNKSEEVVIWGSGTPLREFLYSEDLADACIYLMNHYSESKTVNIGTGKEISIENLALLVKEIIGYEGKLVFDKSKPDGTPRKLLDIGKLKQLGWNYKTHIRDGIRLSYEDYLKNNNK
ncbi:GDP-L-fucose synthase family protein [Candidatus Galacturonibacter soehngenii]|uniref:GDP-L-fucose synthase n=1 Tax=Candidatus Galacturonatibacter soehngenii TaxID=2307010 RepID=A0A7V7QP48_9FIRM|nr:GDP-L-fucose synthase [Candidatus Galacturonibacter soehngenii]KAB1441029.1 GDP-L-fucose synthase [Candidatus Galacturonibacter soehngenii]